MAKAAQTSKTSQTAKTANSVAKGANGKEEEASLVAKFFDKAGDEVHSFFYVVEDGKTVSPRFETIPLVSVCVITVVALASASWAASIASSRRHNPIIHFLLGLCLPLIYPIIILLALDIPGKWTIQNTEKDEEKKKMEAQIQEEEDTKLIPDENGVIPYEPTQEYFTAIARGKDGQHAGPWDVVFNGTPIVVTQIIEALPECVNVEFYDKSPETLRKMRIPFSKIDSWHDKA